MTDESIALAIVTALRPDGNVEAVLEVGPGMGVLTKYLLKRDDLKTTIVDVDQESIQYLNQHFPELGNRILEADFLNVNLTELMGAPFMVIGNFPYNISTQIVFKILENKDIVPQVVGMFQKEVAERFCSQPGSKVYGITSVLVQAFYHAEYLFTVPENVFNPPPKVKSGVIRLTRNNVPKLNCDEKLFVKVVKAAFGQRRKMLRNALSAFQLKSTEGLERFFTQRAEQLSVSDFVEMTNGVDKNSIGQKKFNH